MQWKATLATTTLLLAVTPFAGATDDAEPIDAEYRCIPGQDLTATAVTVTGSTFYNRIYSGGTYYFEELWQESNGESGLQTSAGMSCVGKSDKLVRFTCIGYCPLTF